MEKLSHQEEQIMLEIWKLKECTVRDIQNELPEPKILYTTLAAIVRNIEQKGFIYSKKFGNVYVYYPLVSEDDYKKVSMSAMVKNYFDNSYTKLFSFFAKEEKISPEELRKIIDIIENSEENTENSK